MRLTARLLAAAPLVAVIGLASAALTATGAHAATASAKSNTASAKSNTAPAKPGWRVVASYPGVSSVDQLAAAGPDSAWATERCTKPCASTDGWILRHWNGQTWTVQPQPAAVVKHTGNATPLLAVAPGSRDLWAVFGEYDHAGRAAAVEWTGKSWAAPTLFAPGTDLLSVVASGLSGVWVSGFNENTRQPYAFRDTGKAWTAAPLPSGGAGQAWNLAAGPGGAVWALGFGSKGTSLAASRWNGKSWVAQSVPAAPKGGDGSTNGSGALVVSGKSSVWGYGYFGFAASSKTESGLSWLVHWNGKAWSNVKVPYTLSGEYTAGPLGPDGGSGAWFEAVPYGTTRSYLYHVSAAGQWRRDAIPAAAGTTGTEVTGFAPVPGTSSVYAYGFSAGPGSSRGVILEYT